MIRMMFSDLLSGSRSSLGGHTVMSKLIHTMKHILTNKRILVISSSSSCSMIVVVGSLCSWAPDYMLRLWVFVNDVPVHSVTLSYHFPLSTKMVIFRKVVERLFAIMTFPYHFNFLFLTSWNLPMAPLSCLMVSRSALYIGDAKDMSVPFHY